LRFSEDEIITVDNLLHTAEPSRHVGLYVSAKDRRKVWPGDRYESICRQLLESPDINVLLVGGTEDTERAAALAARLESPRVRVICGRTTVRESILLLGRLTLIVGNDGAPIHMAALSGTPAISVFCNWEVPGFWEPLLAPWSRALRPLWSRRKPATDDFGIESIGTKVLSASLDEFFSSCREPAHLLLTVSSEPGEPLLRAVLQGFPFVTSAAEAVRSH
jgi:hypothetical protein